MYNLIMVLTPFDYAYAVAIIPLLFVWGYFFISRKDLRREMVVMSLGIGLLSLVTAYYWWTIDWWHPPTITGTKIGVEDFVLGFSSGGIMAVAYEFLFKKRHYRSRIKCLHCPGHFTLLLLLAFLTSWLFWGVGLTSFYASSVAIIVTGCVLFYFRRDLFIDGVISGILMVFISLPFYFVIQAVSPEWISEVYHFETLSGFLLLGVPIEEYVFWFLAGLVFGPFYEYWQSERLRKIPK